MVKMRQGGHWQKETRSAAQKTASDEMPPWYKHAKKEKEKLGDILLYPMLAPQSGFLPSSCEPRQVYQSKTQYKRVFYSGFLAFLVATPNRIHMMNIHTYYSWLLYSS